MSSSRIADHANMTTQDSPSPEECRRLLDKDKNKSHVHEFSFVIVGASKNWHRCACGEWE